MSFHGIINKLVWCERLRHFIISSFVAYKSWIVGAFCWRTVSYFKLGNLEIRLCDCGCVIHGNIYQSGACGALIFGERTEEMHEM